MTEDQVPAAQDVQELASTTAEKVPAGQLGQLTPDLYVPGSQPNAD
jgi:hypothetical protein